MSESNKIMGSITRPAEGDETLRLSRCPCCGGTVSMQYVVGRHKVIVSCETECRRKWQLWHCQDMWRAGKQWNKLAASIEQKLRAFALLEVRRYEGPVRYPDLERLEKEAEKLRKQLEANIIGATTQ